MSEANIQVVRAGFEALSEGGVEAMLALVHPDFEVTTPPGLAAEPDTYRGHDGVRRYFESFYEAMDRVTFVADDYIAVGERVVVPFTLHARGRTTGIETEQKGVQVYEVKDGQTFRVEVYATLDEAMEAAEAQGQGSGQGSEGTASD